MIIKLIKNEKDYSEALLKLENIFDAKANSDKGDQLEILSLLIEDYEKKHHAISAPNPIEAIKFRMDQMGLSQAELGKILGYSSRASEILHKKRKLNITMIRNLSEKLNIPASVLLQAY